MVLLLAGAGVGASLLLAGPAAPVTGPGVSVDAPDAPERPEPRTPRERIGAPPAAGKPDALPVPSPPRPFDPSDEPTAGQEEAPITVTVVGQDDRPVAGAVVAILDPMLRSLPVAPAGSRTATTGADGTAKVRFDVRLENAHVLVIARGHAPAFVRVEDRNRQRVKLEGEALLRGRVTVGGVAPKSPVTLEVVAFIDRARGWSDPARRLLRRQGFDASIPFDTGANGEFAVYGLTRGEVAAVRLPDGYVFAGHGSRDTERIRAFDCDGVPVVIELEAANVLTGRLVAPQRPPDEYDRDPPRYEVRGTLTGSKGAVARNVHARPDGGFRMGFPAETLTSVTLEVWEGNRHLTTKKIEETITGSKDLGEIVVDDVVTVAFRFLDPGGRPVAKGKVLASGAVSRETDADGRTELAFSPAVRNVIVGAPHFRIEAVALPESLPASLEVRLKPTSLLVVRVRHDDPSEKLRGLRVAVNYAPDETIARADMSGEFGQVRIARPSGSMSVHGGGTARVRQTHFYEVEPGKDIEVSGFKGGDELEVRLEDSYGHSLFSETVKLGDGEVKAMQIIVTTRPVVVRGTVVDAAGRPIPSARVIPHMTGPLFHQQGVACDAAGVFQLTDVYGETLRILVSAPDHVSKSAGPPEVLRNPVIVLEAARKLTVRLVGNAGATTGMITFEIPGGETFNARRQSDDVWIFESIPRHAGNVRVQGQAGATTTPVGAEDLRIEVPRPE
jgi:hypothetical protein